MSTSNHKYRVSIYIGKDLFNELEVYAKELKVSVNTLCRIMFTEGLEYSMPVIREEMKYVKHDQSKM